MSDLPTLNDLLGPLFTKYGMQFEPKCEPRSLREPKFGLKMLCWRFPSRDFDIFIYEDNTIGLRDWSVSSEVQIDLDMVKPDSCVELEQWLQTLAEKHHGQIE